MVGRMLANKVDDGYLCSARIVQIRDAVSQARAEMEQRAGWLFGHARIAIRGSRYHSFEKAKHTTHLRHAVERGNEMHFRRAWVRETGVHFSSNQRANETFCAVHIIGSALLAGPFRKSGKRWYHFSNRLPLNDSTKTSSVGSPVGRSPSARRLNGPIDPAPSHQSLGRRLHESFLMSIVP